MIGPIVPTRVYGLLNAQLNVSASVDDSITDEEFVATIPALPSSPDIADRFASYFATHPYDFHLSHLQDLFQFYDPKFSTDLAFLAQLSAILLSILSFPSQHLGVLEFFVCNGFHFLLDRFFPEFHSLELMTQLHSASEKVATFSFERGYLEKVESLLVPDSPLALHAIHFVTSFNRSKLIPITACVPAILRLIPLISCQMESDVCLAGLNALRSFISCNSGIFPLIATRSDLMGFLSVVTPECPLTLIATCNLLSAAFKQSVMIDLFQKEAILKFLMPPLAIDDSRLIASAAEVMGFLIDETTASLCWLASFGPRMVELLRADFEYQTQRFLFTALMKLVQHGSREQVEIVISCGLLDLLDDRIEGIREDLEDELVTAVNIIVRFENEEFIAAIREKAELMQALLAFCDLQDDVRARLLL
jgi:hypothetical protein